MADGDTDRAGARPVAKGTDLVEWYFEQGWTDGLPVVPPTAEKVAAMRRRARRRARISSNAGCRRATAA